MQKGQEVVIRCDVNCQDFAHLIAQKAYEFGAKKVHMEWRDEKLDRINMLNATKDAICDIPKYQTELWNYFIDRKCCLISISAEDPNKYKGCDANKLSAYQIAFQTARQLFRNATMSNYLRWTIVSVPTPEWAKQVFPERPRKRRGRQMWDAIARIMRLDTPDPTAAWRKHIETLVSREIPYGTQFRIYPYEKTNRNRFESRTCGRTRLDCRGGRRTRRRTFTANMPTEEVFTAPHNRKIDGTVVNALPLVNNGNVIDDFSITFKDGKVVDYKAKIGYDALKGLLESDEGVLSLGEIALIGKNSPIAQSGILFTTRCSTKTQAATWRFGASYPTTVKGGNDMTDEQLAARGMNQSIQHVDFMVGTKDIDIDGIGYDGKVVPIFRDGDWII